jgi:hypothetical protein
MNAEYDRVSPSPRYRELLEQYRQMHVQGDPNLGVAPEDMFPGKSLPPQAGHIRRLIGLTGAATILDYGSGKGVQYQATGIVDGGSGVEIEYPDIRSYWGVDSVTCYDPGYAPFSQLPQSKFDGVICTDVLEHCPEEDMAWIVTELFSFARLFVFANVACFPALKRLPSGDNAHCTIRPVKWWQELIGRCAASYPSIVYEVRLAYLKPVTGKQIRMEAVLSSEAPGKIG